MTQTRALNVGIVGLGTAGGGIAPAVAAMKNVHLAGAADVNGRALEVFRERYGRQDVRQHRSDLRRP
jgi:predicted dehydrogenase